MNTQFFPFVIAVVMLSLGLSLTPADFRRVAKIPRPVLAALFCQTILLPGVCFLIVKLFALPPVLAVGLMLMAAAPGGSMASIFSHMVNGDLALNLTLTAINTVLSIVTLPIIVALSMAYFMDHHDTIPLQSQKILQVFLVIGVPVSVGMMLRWRFPKMEERFRRAIKLVAALFVVAVGVLALVTGWTTLASHFALLGGAVLSLNIVSLAVGYAVSYLMRLGKQQAIAISTEIGLHNAALAIAIASTPGLIGNAEMAVPAALYGVTMPFVAMAFVFVINRIDRRVIQRIPADC